MLNGNDSKNWMIEESTSGPLEKMTDQEVPMYLKENVHSPHTNTGEKL